ncbi:hypothetical protein H2201_004118 [Coniosporium apollinis]|uniref:Cytochrome P450 n=1 Tax=Coniosporium apollinis TaxID=61459 RepID=A0ABQ9NTU7_9PEZI|nr:hypothetical protein H2201_004118 [Coniosporium apollinis]
MESLLAHPSIILVVFALVAYLIGGAIYRLYFSPIAHSPGPRLAALTLWYEFYYDVVCKGRYTWEIEKMHEKYGPIVRINPYEIHVKDPSFYDEVYVGPSRRTEKWHWSAKMFGTTTAAVGTTGHELHRVRRGALNPFFSKRSVTRLEPVIQANVDRLCARLKEFAGTAKPVNLFDAFTALSADVIGSFAFGRSYGFLEHADFNPRWHRLMMELSGSTHLMKQFGWLYTFTQHIPQWLVALVHPLTKELFSLQNSISDQIHSIQTTPASALCEKPTDHPTIFHDLLSSKLPPSELTLPRLTEEGLTLIGAGTVTTSHTLATTVYHLLSAPSKLSRLRSELATLTNPTEPSRPLTWTQLEHLPYLSAIVSEGLRLSYGVSHRLQRVSPDAALRYGDWVIPAGTPVSMTQMFIHNDAGIFESPSSFIPERWLPSSSSSSSSSTGESDATAADPSHLRKYLVPFSRGTRSCVGMNLAYAEIFLALGALFRPVGAGGVELDLFETDRGDVEVVHDFFNPSPRLDSKGVRVLVRG